MKVSSRKLFWYGPVAAVLLVFSGVAAAEVRLLIGFENNEFKLEKVIKNNKKKRVSSSRTATKKPILPRLPNPANSKAYVAWIDRFGEELSRQPLRDPRLIHAPVGNNAMETNLEYRYQPQGVFFLIGPNDAASVKVILPVLVLPSDGGKRVYLEKIDWQIDL